MRLGLLTTVAVCTLCVERTVLAQDATTPEPITTEQAQSAINAADAKTDQSTLPTAPLESPPPPPRKNGFVLEQSIGAIGFAGKFGGLVGHPSPWLQTIFGYELFKCRDDKGERRACPFEIMVYGEGDLTLTDTGQSSGPSQNRPFPIISFGGGVRFGFHFTNRVGMYLQGVAGGDVAYVQPGVLQNYGYLNAESVGFNVGGRLGFEWYQVDRHIAIGVSGGARYMLNLAYAAGSDLPLAWDATFDLRYAF